ncbi:MAG: asparagine synthase (glutamine-hydrolyzing), partial [Rhodopirellula sp.]|nr:asparagine synthase (glutamine-hydrolyzing) [Rhodopirellula sp.]
MCGITGVVYFEPGRSVDPGVLKRMADSIAHRGPDAEGFHIDRNVGLAHRRLSIIDLEGGDQPIGNEDGSIQVVFNGEIYNFRELRSELESKGHRFRTFSDTEVIVHLYEELGDRCVERLRGMFAIALWDSRQQRLLLARDRVGIKPLFVSFTDKRIAFGSELKPLLAHGDVRREIDPAAIDEYLHYGVIPGDRCIFRGVEKLRPGHLLTVDTGSWQVERRRYWQLNFEADESLSVDEWQEAILAKLDETVRLHLLADV